MRGYQTLIEAKNRVEAALELTDDVDVYAIRRAVALLDGQYMTRHSFDDQVMRFDRAFHGLILSGYAAVGD